MEKKPVNASDKLIDRMAAGLRADGAGEAPAALEQRMMAVGTRPLRSPRPVLRYALAAVAAGAAGLMLWPGESAAAMLERIVQANDASAFRHELRYEMGKNGRFELVHEYYGHRGEGRLIDYRNQVDLYSSTHKRVVYFKKEKYATVDEEFPSKERAWFPSLKEIIRVNAGLSGKVSRTPDVMWEGKKVDQYIIESNGPDANGRVLHYRQKVLSEVGSDRVVYLEGETEGFPITATKFDYPKFDSRLLNVDVPKSVPTYNLPEQRKSLKTMIRGSLGTQTVGGVKVELKAVIVDSATGGIMAITTGGEGRIESASQVLGVGGMEGATVIGYGVLKGKFMGGKFVYPALEWEGAKIVAESAMFARGALFPERLSISIPIWKADDSPEGRRFAGYARFQGVTPIRTSAINELVAPMNVSIFAAPGDVLPVETPGQKAVESGG